MAFQCTVATPDGLLFEGTITGAIVPAHDGEIGILTDRAPILLKLGAGPLTLHAQGGDKVFFVAGGVAQMKDNVLTVLSDEATTADKLNVDAAKKDVAELTDFKTTLGSEAAARDRKLTRARAVLRMAGVTA
jgi:F-type H+-transporting ATPase subunit epsilon